MLAMAAVVATLEAIETDQMREKITESKIIYAKD